MSMPIGTPPGSKGARAFEPPNRVPQAPPSDEAGNITGAASPTPPTEAREVIDDSQFQTHRDLQKWLEKAGIDTKPWSGAQYKSVERLWGEVCKAESVLVRENDCIVREVEVMNVQVRRGENFLTEKFQQQREGNFRVRFLPQIGEKMLPGEDWITAIYRACSEELRVAADACKIDKATHRVTLQNSDSKSYPGLAAVYKQHFVFVDIPTLPDGDFATDEYDEGGRLVGRHFWGWMPEGRAHDLQKLKNHKFRREDSSGEADESAGGKPELLNCVESPEDQALICALLRGWKCARLERIAGGFSGSFVLLAEDPAKVFSLSCYLQSLKLSDVFLELFEVREVVLTACLAFNTHPHIVILS